MENWHQMSNEAVLEQLESNIEIGLTEEDAENRLKKYGPNELVDRGKKSWLKILWHQLSDTMLLILMAAMVISGWAADIFDSLVIAFIIILNVIMGFFQEYKTEQALQALKAKATHTTRVIRNGKQEEILANKLVPGDLVILEAGTRVPADGRIIESIDLQVEESSLTGESQPVDKITGQLLGEFITLGDQVNMVFSETIVTNGRGKMIVVKTGMETEIGKIADLVQDRERQTPLQKRLSQMGVIMAWAALVVCLIIFGLGYLRGVSLQVLTMTAISLAVAVVPESLPTVVTIVLALGAKKMLKHQALVRKLSAVETLGSVSVICSDKTGTLTQKGMEVENIYSIDSITGESRINYLLMGMVLCNDARIDVPGEHPNLGDPTEIALLVKAKEEGFFQSSLEEGYPRINEVPFDSNRKLMSTLHKSPENQPLMFTKGAFDNLVRKCLYVAKDSSIVPWESRERTAILQKAEELAQQGVRVLGVAYKLFKEWPKSLGPEDEDNLIFVGLVGIINPLREEVMAAVETCRLAGIKIVMITGDHPLTALAIGNKLGIIYDETQLAIGSQLDEMSLNELTEKAQNFAIYARVSPENKMNIVKALQANKKVVAMTGDGVNDAPALKKADIGVAMGITGTDVSKQAADMVLLDDNFTTIVKAVKMGRTIYDNIRKFACYMLTANFSQVLLILLAMALALPLPLLPIHILWINLFAEGLPAFALSMEPSEKGIMKRPVRPANESIFARGVGGHIIWVGTLMALLSLGLMVYVGEVPQQQSMVLTTFVFLQLFHVLAIRSTRESFFKLGLLTNSTLLMVVVLFALLQIMVLYLPILQVIFKTVPLSLEQLGQCLGLGLTVFILVEFEKFCFRKLSTRYQHLRKISRRGIFE